MTDEQSTPAVDSANQALEQLDSSVPESTTPAAETTEQQTPQPSEPAATGDETAVSDEAKELAEWSEKRGTPIDPNNINEVRLAKSLRDTQREFHDSRQPKAPSIGETIEKHSSGDELQDELAEIRVERHFRRNPGHEKYRDKMNEIASRVYEEDPSLGRSLAMNPTLLYNMAVGESIDKMQDEAAQKAAQETREQLARESQTTTARPAATVSTQSDKKVLTQSEFNNLSEKEYRDLNGNFEIRG